MRTINMIDQLDTMLKDLATTGYYQSIREDGDEYVLSYEKTWAIHGDMEPDSVSYDSDSWEMRVPHDDIIADHTRYRMIKTIMEVGQTDELIEFMFNEGDFNDYVFLMSYETLTLIAHAIEENIKEMKEDANIEQEIELYALVNKRMKEY